MQRQPKQPARPSLVTATSMSKTIANEPTPRRAALADPEHLWSGKNSHFVSA